LQVLRPKGLSLDFTSPAISATRFSTSKALSMAHTNHDVGIGIVAQASLGSVMILFMKFIRSHHFSDAVTAGLPGSVPISPAQKTADIEEHLGAIFFQKFQITGCMIVLPHIVGNGK
jgi:hypothetical protein